MEKHTIELTKNSEKRLNVDKIRKQIEKIVARVIAGGRGQRGWKVDVEGGLNRWNPIPRRPSEQKSLIYTCKLVLTVESNRKAETIKQDFNNIIKIIGVAGNIPDWRVATIDGRMVDNKDDRLPKEIGYVPVEIPANWRESFTEIYERDAQIDILMSCIEAAILSNFHDRFHVALVGPPACGKSLTLHAVKKVLGEDAVLEYDATATTQAGAIKDLDMREELPRILIVEEIEKTDENSLRWLLSVMDHRAEIRKVNYRESIQRETKLLTLATVNDYKLFNKIMYGALASRFAYHLEFQQPGRTLLQKILEREVTRVNGDKRWIKPTLDFAEADSITDPRKVTAICLCGRDALFTGEYQKKLKLCSTAHFLRE